MMSGVQKNVSLGSTLDMSGGFDFNYIKIPELISVFGHISYIFS